MTEFDSHAKAKMARQFMAAIPYSRALGMELEELENGVAVISMPYDARLVGAPVEAEPEMLEIGHPVDQCRQQRVAALLDDLHRFGAPAAHAPVSAAGRSTVKAPAAVATGWPPDSSVAEARTKATLRVM